MQTFLPVASFKKSLRLLDKKRLGKQRVEAWQMYRALRGITWGWRYHPATLMWRGYETALLYYMKFCIEEFARRGGRNIKMQVVYDWVKLYLKDKPLVYPDWMGDERVHSTHRANLVRKDYDYYAIGKGFKEAPLDGYYYPPPKKRLLKVKQANRV